MIAPAPLIRPGAWHQEKPLMQAQSKQCAQCGATFHPTPGRSRAQWAKQQYCTGACANTWRAQQQTKAPTTTRREGARWAAWWERQRQRQDRTELRTWKPKAWPHCRLDQQPKPRLFIGRHCQAEACASTWVSYAAMPDTIYCKPCNRARWRETHYERAARHGAQFDVIDPLRIFQRDNWRCQLCGCKTHKTGWPNPKRATLDHIVPLARGGHHIEQNLQCACWHCNARKGARSANDQLRLAV